jgi:TolA-binding protein
MNQLSNKFTAAALAVLLMTSASALAREKKPKKKKDQDLSANPLANVNSKQPDKELFDKAMSALKKGRFDVARLDLQTMLNTYPDSEYRMRAKLAVGDTWFKEGGTALSPRRRRSTRTSSPSSPMRPRLQRPRCVWATFTSARWTSLIAIMPRPFMHRKSTG